MQNSKVGSSVSEILLITFYNMQTVLVKLDLQPFHSLHQYATGQWYNASKTKRGPWVWNSFQRENSMES